MQSNPCDPCNPPVVKWVNPQPAQIWNPCDPCAPVMYNPCPPVNCNPCAPTQAPAQLRGGKDFFDIQVTECVAAGLVPGGTTPLNNFCGNRKAILVVNVADNDPSLSQANLTQLRILRGMYPAGDFEILALGCNQFGFSLGPFAGDAAFYTAIAAPGGGGNLPYRLLEN